VNEEKNSFDEAVSEWRLKNGIRDDDSVLQMLELLKIFFQNVKIEIPPDIEKRHCNRGENPPACSRLMRECHFAPRPPCISLERMPVSSRRPIREGPASGGAGLPNPSSRPRRSPRVTDSPGPRE
jgi:hypothetical protein